MRFSEHPTWKTALFAAICLGLAACATPVPRPTASIPQAVSVPANSAIPVSEPDITAESGITEDEPAEDEENTGTEEQAVVAAAAEEAETLDQYPGDNPEATLPPFAGFTGEPADTDVPEAGTSLARQTDENLPGTDIWPRIRAGLLLSGRDHPRVTPELDWYLKHPEYFQRIWERAEPYLHYIVEEVERRGMPMEIALLPAIESAFQPMAYSSSRASGLWQFIPGTARFYGLRMNWWYDGRRDIMAATHAALDYLEKLNNDFRGDWLLSLAAYNAGEGAVMRAVQNNARRGKPTDFWSLKLPRETRHYVPRLLAVAELTNAPEAHGLTLKPIADESYFAHVNTGSQLDLNVAAELADMELSDLYQLNPGFNRWATNPDGPHRLLLPEDKIPLFEERLAALPAEDRVRWGQHEVRSGETLSHIAKTYRTTVVMLKELNHLRNNNLRPGQPLLVPAVAHQRTAAGGNDNAIVAATGGTRIQVENGDTLWDLARRHGVRVTTLASWNNIGVNDTLRPGQSLVIRKNAAPPLALTPAAEHKVTYVVRRGDSLFRISKRFNVSIENLAEWNSLDTDNLLRPGQRLTVYLDITRLADNS